LKKLEEHRSKDRPLQKQKRAASEGGRYKGLESVIPTGDPRLLRIGAEESRQNFYPTKIV
jgi:hypothetical protein